MMINTGLLALVWLCGLMCGLGLAGSAYAVGRRSWRRGTGSIGSISQSHLQTLRSDSAKELGL